MDGKILGEMDGNDKFSSRWKAEFTTTTLGCWGTSNVQKIHNNG